MKLKILIILPLFFSLISTAKAQNTVSSTNAQPCLIKVKDSPKVQGLRLEMTRAEVEKEYPLMVFTNQFTSEELESKDVLAGMAMKAEITNPAYKANLDQVSIIFGKNSKILTISFVFNELVSETSLKVLSEKISETLKLPKELWQPSRSGHNLAIYCDGFGIVTGFNNEKKQILFLAKNPKTLTEEERKILKP